MYFVILTVRLFICIFDALLFGGNKESINQSIIIAAALRSRSQTWKLVKDMRPGIYRISC